MRGTKQYDINVVVMKLAELISNNEIVQVSFILSWVCIALAGVLVYFTREEGRILNTVLTLLLPVDILVGTAFAYVGSGVLNTRQIHIICAAIIAAAVLVIILGLIWKSSTSVGLAAIGFEFAIISTRLFGGFTALSMSAYIVLIAFVHGLRKWKGIR